MLQKIIKIFLKNTIKQILFFLIFISVMILSHSSTKASSATQDKTLSAFSDYGRYFENNYNRLLSDYKIVSYCDGSFKNSGVYEYALGVIDNGKNEARYIIMLYNSKNKLYITTLAKYHISKSEINSGNLPEVDCMSAMEIRRLNTTIKSSESITGKIKPISNFDSICIIDPIDSNTNHSCYSYDGRTRKFIQIGGWST